MTGRKEETLTKQDLATLLQDGHPGLTANISRIALGNVIEEWENDDRKAEKLEALRESPITPDSLSPTNDYDADEEEFYLALNDAPPILNRVNPCGTFKAAQEFAQDYYDTYCNEYRELFEQSTLTKKQFMVYLMKAANKNEHVIAGALDMEIGTMRSHAGRARKKVEKAENTARIPELFYVGDSEEFRNEIRGLLEPSSV